MKNTYLFFCLIISFFTHAQIRYELNLGELQNDRLMVRVFIPAQKQDRIVFNFPKIVPGTYANYDFGRYISSFKAFDKSGKNIQVKQLNVNQYEIARAKEVVELSYWVDDTWDSPEIKGEYIFEPAGSNFQQDTLFTLNTHSLLGFIQGQEKQPVKLTIKHPKALFGSTSMVSTGTTTRDEFTSKSYQTLIDHPILYAQPDTTSLKLANAEILISVYSPNQAIQSKQVAATLEPLLDAQRKYLGGTFPVNKYAFLIVLSTDLKGGSFGALEHSQSSFYYLPEGAINEIGQTIRDVSAHEFFHILSPLNSHSEEIGDFNFISPSMSEHLWLYEGLTEYAAHHMQIKYDLIDLKTFWQTIQEKKETMDAQFDPTVSFTTMSKGVLGKYKQEYGNVYQKGALIGFGIDLYLRKASNGLYGTQEMMRDLAKQYGPDKSFKDNELIDILVEITKQKGLKDFYLRYIAGTTPLPLDEWLAEIGYFWNADATEQTNTLGFDPQGLSINPETKRAVIQSKSAINALGFTLGLQEKDELVRLNGEPTDLAHFVETTQKFLANVREKDIISWDIARKDSAVSYQIIHLKAPFIPITRLNKQAIQAVNNPSDAQKALFRAWKDVR